MDNQTVFFHMTFQNGLLKECSLQKSMMLKTTTHQKTPNTKINALRKVLACGIFETPHPKNDKTLSYFKLNIDY